MPRDNSNLLQHYYSKDERSLVPTLGLDYDIEALIPY